MCDDHAPFEKGSKVRVDLNNVYDRLPKSLLESLSVDPVGKIVDFKLTDGSNIGMLVQLNDGTINWFFEQELLYFDSAKNSFLRISQNQKRKDIFLVNIPHRTITNQSPYLLRSKPSHGIIGLFNPFYFLKWITFSLKDVF